MKTSFLRHIFILVLMLIPYMASAQFYVTGDDPGKLKWHSLETDHFKVIYPEGTDSLARTYAAKIEKFRIPVSLSSGYISGQGDGRKMPVVLHAYNAANGSVAWAPKRMDLFTVPSAYDPEPIPWSTMLSVHESRHVTQMQFGMTGALKPFGWFFGEMWNILVSLVYPGISNMEGDAVITETAWTPSGRGRTADFLNYYWVAFDQGDFRSWNRWRFVSQKHNAPNYYSLGYLTMGGFRYLYDCPEFMSEGYHLAARRPYNLGAFHTTAKKLTGKKFKHAFMEVCDTMYTLWNASAEARRPYIPSEPVTAKTRMYTEYSNNLVVGSDIYAIKKGHVDVPTLVRIDSTGKEHRISTFSYDVGRLQKSDGKLYWSEGIEDERWSLQTHSKIRFMEDGSRKKHTLDNEKLLYNPAPSGDRAAVTVYEVGGRSGIDIIDLGTGKSLQSFHAPDSLQITETAWISEDIYAAAISDNGYGIYRLKTGSEGLWETILAPQPVMIKDFSSHEGELIFACDRTGVHELYHLSPSDGILRQKTSLRYGASDFQYSEDGKWLYYSSQTLDGKRIYKTATDSLMDKSVDFTERHLYPIAEKITQQERELAAARGVKTDMDVNISEPQRYRKFPHMFNVHSWAPVYVNVDNIMNMSFDRIWQAASLGATGIIQNRLATAVGEFGYSAHRDPYNAAKWRHSAHARFTYSGLYPMFELSLDFNDRAARQYTTYVYRMDEDRASVELSSKETAAPYIQGTASAYIPFNFSSGGWYRGLIPKMTYRIGNDMFNKGLTIMDIEDHVQTGQDGSIAEVQRPVFAEARKGRNVFMHSLSGSVRGYAIQATPNSAVYPRWGIGAETGVSADLESSYLLSPMGYFYTYGYVPGIMKEHGIKLTAMSQYKLNRYAVFGQTAVNILPRGLASNSVLASWLALRNDVMTKISADYALPIYIGDLSIGGSMFSIKRLVLTPHFDCTVFSNSSLFSAGADLILDMHSILTLEWPCSFGVSFSYNGGPAFNSIAANSGIAIDRWHVGPTFNVSF